MNTNEALHNFCLRLGDNSLILGQRFAEWCGSGPILEEDLAMTNISLDLFGQAENIFDYAAELENAETRDEYGNIMSLPQRKTADYFAFFRDERGYFNNLLAEQPNGDFASTVMRGLLFSCFMKNLYSELSSNSKDEKLSALSEKALKEVKYHFRHASEWVIRLGLGTEESLQRAQNALNALWIFTEDMFEMNETDQELIAKNISIDLKENIYLKWKRDVEDMLAIATLRIPENEYQVKGGINGIHTEHLGHLLCELQFLQRAYPDAKW